MVELSDIPFREPIIADEEQYSNEELRALWSELVCHAFLQVLEADSPTECDRFREYITAKICETLPRVLLTKFPEKQERHSQLADYLEKEPVPDELIEPDLRRVKSATIESIFKIKCDSMRQRNQRRHERDEEPLMSEAEIRAKVLSQMEQEDYTGLLSPAEQKMVALRYEFARDIKLLALAEELKRIKSHEINFEEERPLIVTENKIRFIYNESRIQDLNNIFDIRNWKSKTRINNRVYLIELNSGEKYLLKEKKTKRHTGTHMQGFDSKRSFTEFNHAERLSRDHAVDADEIKLTWEVPITAVRFPDGYSFVIFEYYEGIQPTKHGPCAKEFLDDFSDAMCEAPDHYQEEFNQALALLATEFSSSFSISPSEICFKDFARAYTAYLVSVADNLHELTMTKAEFIEAYNEGADTGFRVIRDDKRKPQVEIVGFDFEYTRTGATPPFIIRDMEKRLNGDVNSWIPFYYDLMPNEPKYHALYAAVLKIKGIEPDIENIKSWKPRSAQKNES